MIRTGDMARHESSDRVRENYLATTTIDAASLGILLAGTH